MLVHAIRCNGEAALIVEHAGESLLIAIKGPGTKYAKVVLCGPDSFRITRGGSIAGAALGEKGEK